jgi:hypothetical protein
MPSSAKYIDTTTIPARGRDSGCPRCGGEVFHAEQMFSKGKIYHKVNNINISLQGYHDNIEHI